MNFLHFFSVKITYQRSSKEDEGEEEKERGNNAKEVVEDDLTHEGTKR